MESFGKLLKRSWHAFRTHWLINVIIVFIVGILVSGYTLSTKSVIDIKADPSTIIDETNIPDINLEDGIDINLELDPDQVRNNINKANDISSRVTGNSNADILEELLEGINHDPDKNLKDTAGTRYTKGVISVFVNQVSSSGSLVFGVLEGVNTLVFKGKIGTSILIFVGTLLMIFNIAFIKNIVLVGQSRYFIEHRLYKDVRADRILFVYRYGKTLNVAKIMLLRSLFLSLWKLTIIGGFIKSYEYSMIPYIVAENPAIHWKEAFKLSKELTRGYKRRMFGYDVIYAIGYIISSFTFNALSVFLLDPLHVCLYAEMYADLRVAGRKANVPNIELLNDPGLDGSIMRDAIYPENIYPLKPLEKRQWLKIDYRKDYSISTLILFFFSFSLVGYVWEVFYTLVAEGILCNRGTMFGPWLPIYGFGGLLIMICLKPLREHPLLCFLGAFTLCGMLEYFASWMLEVLFHTKWWDYTGFFLNINGRICLEGLLVFGLAGVAFTYIFSPLLDNLYHHLKPSARKALCIILPILFAIDLAYSAFNPNKGAGITSGEPAPETSIEQVETEA